MKLIKSILAAIIAFCFIHLCSCYAMGDFDIKNWHPAGRIFIGFLCMFASLVAGFGIFGELNKPKP